MNVEKAIGLVKNKAYLLRDGFEIRLGKSQTEYMCKLVFQPYHRGS